MVPEDFYTIMPELSARDETCAGYLREIEKLEPLYDAIMVRIPEKDRAILERYIWLCEEREYQKTRLAAAHYAIAGAKIFVA